MSYRARRNPALPRPLLTQLPPYIRDSSIAGCCRRFDIFLHKRRNLLLITDVSQLKPAPLLQPRGTGLTTTRRPELDLLLVSRAHDTIFLSLVT